MLIITGPTAAGKNTVAMQLARQRGRCAVVDFDLVRRMFVQPHEPPWAGEEGRAQQVLGVHQVCSLAEGFVAAGWEVIILDVLSDMTADIYYLRLGRFLPRVVQLLPTFSELSRRFHERGPVLTEEELKVVYEEQIEYTKYDLRIDNTRLEPQEVASQVASWLSKLS
jgi:broad-specificity NMP kinase